MGEIIVGVILQYMVSAPFSSAVFMVGKGLTVCLLN